MEEFQRQGISGKENSKSKSPEVVNLKCAENSTQGGFYFLLDMATLEGFYKRAKDEKKLVCISSDSLSKR